MSKKLYRAQVKLTVIRQVEFTADENLTDDELDDMAGKIALNVSGCDDFQVLELECRGKLTGDLSRAEKQHDEVTVKCKS